MIDLLMMLAASTSTFMNGNELHGQCISTDNGQQLLCMGYIVGVSDGIAIAQTAAQPEHHSICIAATADRRQIVDVVKNYMRDHPADRNRTASALIYVSLREAFPCGG